MSCAILSCHFAKLHLLRTISRRLFNVIVARNQNTKYCLPFFQFNTMCSRKMLLLNTLIE